MIWVVIKNVKMFYVSLGIAVEYRLVFHYAGGEKKKGRGSDKFFDIFNHMPALHSRLKQQTYFVEQHFRKFEKHVKGLTNVWNSNL